MPSAEIQAQRLANFQRNDPELFEKYMRLPEYVAGLCVRCPTKNIDGSPCSLADIPGCGSANVAFDGDVYDCLDCGIFFSDYAADPPHRRPSA